MTKKEKKKLDACLLKQLELKKGEILAALDRGEEVQIVLDFGTAGRKCLGVFGLG